MANVMQELSRALASAVEQVQSSVVRVEGRRRPASGVVWTEELVLTAHHVLQRDEALTIGLANGEEVSASLVGRDPHTDLALLRVPKGGLVPATFRDADDLATGELTLALARPGKNIRASLRIIGLLGKDVRTPGGHLEHYIETDRGFPPGFSGGPLVDATGKVLGVNSGVLLRGADLTLGLTTLKRVSAELLAHGSVRRGYLGVQVLPVELPEAISAAVRQPYGSLVTGLEEGGPAAKSGLLLGDALITLGGAKLEDAHDLTTFVAQHAGETIEVQLLRAGKLVAQSLSIGERAP